MSEFQPSDPTDVRAAETPTAETPTAETPVVADRTYRSKPGIVAGVLLLALVLWLGIDAAVKGSGRTPWTAVAVLLLLVPLISAFSFLPVVRANADRLFVRNPFRTVDAPWSEVESVRAALSVELRAAGRKYQIWAIPVSLRERKRTNRKSMIAKGDASVTAARDRGSRYPAGGPGLRSRTRSGSVGGYGDSGASGASGAWADRAVEELTELGRAAAERAASGDVASTGTVVVAWTWYVIAPALLGAVALAVLLATG